MLAFWAGFLSCGLIALFLYANNTSVTLHFWRWDFENVSLGLVALLPLAAGVATGYLYHMPARMHHLGEHMRHRKRVHELEKEIEQLKRAMDGLVEMPGETRQPPALEARPVPALEAPADGEVVDLPEETAVPVRLKALPEPKRIPERRRKLDVTTPPAIQAPPSEPA
jgi:uncharacterized integral membrane protein